MEEAVYDYETRIPAGFYDKVYRRKLGVRYCWHDLKFRTVAAFLGSPRRVLDIGCGPGTFIGNYLPGVEALGIDISAAQIEYATRTYGSSAHRFSTSSLARLSEADERFDAVTVVELLEHLTPTEAIRLLSEARVRFFQSLGYQELDVEGVGIVITDAALQYKSEAFHGETLVFAIAPDDFNKYGFDLMWQATDKATGREVARGKTGLIFFDYAARKPAPIPPPFLAKLGRAG